MNVNQQTFRNGPGQRSRAMALVITLILLALITFMAVTFLIISQRERGSVSTTTDATTARFAADAALERAKAEILAPILAITNDQAYDIVVSTNYINRDGFFGLSSNAAWNVNYDFNASVGGPTTHPPLSAAELQTNIANLLYDPRVPVYTQTNPLYSGKELRFYLDLNRNARFESNGWWPALGDAPVAAPLNHLFALDGTPTNIAAGPLDNVISNFFIGDPEWVGQLEHPDQFHSSSNRFTSRWAFIAIPASKTLDINYIDNQAYQASVGTLTVIPGVNEGYLRNQGVGSWELNLAAFLADLNTNQWNTPFSPYNYQRPITGVANNGVAFDDAMVIKSNRYNGNLNSLPSVHVLYGAAGDSAMTDPNNDIDYYSDGGLQRTPAATNTLDDTTIPWAGADNTYHFFTAQEYFNAGNMGDFVDRLSTPSFNTNTYDRYTYYRMISQMGTDSRAERGKININYVNVDSQGNIVPLMTTNFIRWGALQFFTNAADRVLKTYTTEWFKQDPSNYLATFYNIHTNFYFGHDPNNFNLPYFVNNSYGWGLTNIPFYGMTNQIPSFGVTNIPVYINGKKVYSASVQRLLQLTANIFDSTTNRTDTSYPFLPSVFRPIYYKPNDSSNVFIATFHEETDATSLNLLDSTFDELPAGVLVVNKNVYGMPWIIGAKKGFPNFNQLAFDTSIQVTRKLQAIKSTLKGPVVEIDQMYELGLTNYVVVSAWNSYMTNFPRPLEMRMTNDFRYVLTGTNGITIPFPIGTAYKFGMLNDTNIAAKSWKKYVPGISPLPSLLSFTQTEGMLSNGVYVVKPGSPRFIPGTNATFASVGPASDPMPLWYLVTSNRFRYALIDTSLTPNRVVDYVNLDMSSNVTDITGLVLGSANCPPLTGPLTGYGDFWCTNAVTPDPFYPNITTEGVDLQIMVSDGQLDSGGLWQDSDANIAAQTSQFRNFLNKNLTNSLTQETPFNPTFQVDNIVYWQANDPLVHYTLDDLRTLPTPLKFISPPTDENTRYAPWKGNPGNPNPPDDYNLTIKDPLMTNSMAWDFPSALFPNVGWLGRIHRGTPWQTVYLKSQDPSVTNWVSWSGHEDPAEAARTIPSEDRLLFDIFTTAVNDNATRGQLSVNQTGLADWSAALSGVAALTNIVDDDGLDDPSANTYYAPWFIEPAGAYNQGNMTALARIWQGINDTRSSSVTNIVSGTNAVTDAFPNKLFAHVGDVLATPELTVRSPYLNQSSDIQAQLGISDEVYERIPQQIMGLLTLKHEPRYVIYCFGQALRPADRSIVMSGPMFGLCTNYQVTGETAVRVVVRIENAPRPGEPNKSPRVVVESYNILPPD